MKDNSNTDSSVAVNLERYLTFSVGDEKYGVPLKVVKEVSSSVPTSKIPGMPDYYKGITNIRGRVVSVLDLMSFLRDATLDFESPCIILETSQNTVGILVNNVDKVLAFSEDQIQRDLELIKGNRSEFFSGVAKTADNIIMLVDTDKLVSMKFISQIVERLAN
jgi:purine-binding chemotaxis protein CheW